MESAQKETSDTAKTAEVTAQLSIPHSRGTALSKDTLLWQTLTDYKAVASCSTWVCWCSKHSACEASKAKHFQK